MQLFKKQCNVKINMMMFSCNDNSSGIRILKFTRNESQTSDAVYDELIYTVNDN